MGSSAFVGLFDIYLENGDSVVIVILHNYG